MSGWKKAQPAPAPALHWSAKKGRSYTTHGSTTTAPRNAAFLSPTEASPTETPPKSHHNATARGQDGVMCCYARWKVHTDMLPVECGYMCHRLALTGCMHMGCVMLQNFGPYLSTSAYSLLCPFSTVLDSCACHSQTTKPPTPTTTTAAEQRTVVVHKQAQLHSRVCLPARGHRMRQPP